MSKFFEDKRDEAFGVNRHASMGSIRAKNMEMFFRKEQPDELAIRQVLLSAFRSEQEAKLVDRLRQSGRLSISLVAESSSTIIGQIAFSPATLISQLESKSGLGLAPLVVVPQWQRHGTGAELRHCAPNHSLPAWRSMHPNSRTSLLPIERNPALTRSLPPILAVRCHNPERY